MRTSVSKRPRAKSTLPYANYKVRRCSGASSELSMTNDLTSCLEPHDASISSNYTTVFEFYLFFATDGIDI